MDTKNGVEAFCLIGLNYSWLALSIAISNDPSRNASVELGGDLAVAIRFSQAHTLSGLTFTPSLPRWRQT